MGGRPVIVVLLVVLAGCNGAFGGSEDPTVTPAAVPTDRATSTDVPALAPGLTRRGVENPEELLAAHAAALEDRSFTTRSNTTVAFANGSVVTRATSGTDAGPSGATVRLVVDRNGTVGTGTPAHTEAWQRDGELFVNRTDANGTSRYNRIAVGSEQRVGVYGAGGLEYLMESLAPGDTSVTERQRNGSTVYVVRGSVEDETMDEARVRLVVDPAGRIHRYRVVEGTFHEGASATSTTVVTYDDVGSTEPPARPAWVDIVQVRTTADPTRTTGVAATNTTGAGLSSKTATAAETTASRT